MLSWIFNSQKKELQATHAQYLILQKLKYVEELAVNHNNEIFHLQMENKKLEQEIKRLRQHNMFLNHQMEQIHNTLDRSIVLQPSEKKFIEN